MFETNMNTNMQQINDLKAIQGDISNTWRELVSRYNYHHCDDEQPSMKLCKRLVKPKL